MYRAPSALEVKEQVQACFPSGWPLPLTALVVDYIVVTVTNYREEPGVQHEPERERWDTPGYAQSLAWCETAQTWVTWSWDSVFLRARRPPVPVRNLPESTLWGAEFNVRANLAAVFYGLYTACIVDTHTGEVLHQAQINADDGEVVFDPHRELWAVQHHGQIQLGSRAGAHTADANIRVNRGGVQLSHGWLLLRSEGGRALYTPDSYCRPAMILPRDEDECCGLHTLHTTDQGQWATLAASNWNNWFKSAHVQCWDLTVPCTVWQWWHPSYTWALKFDPDGRLLARVDNTNTARLFDGRVRQPVVVRWNTNVAGDDHRAYPARELVFSPDGARLLLRQSAWSELWDLRAYKKPVWSSQAHVVHNRALTRFAEARYRDRTRVWTADCVYQSELPSVY